MWLAKPRPPEKTWQSTSFRSGKSHHVFTAVKSVWRRRSHDVVPLGALAVTLLLLASYSPLSPFNNHRDLLQDYDQNPSQITSTTTADLFMEKAIALIPNGASVLTQNNVPQLTGREAFNYAFPGRYTSNVTNYAFVLADNDPNNTNSQFWYSALEPFVYDAYESGVFGTLATGDGVLLLEKEYTQGPVLDVPQYFPGNQLRLFSGYRRWFDCRTLRPVSVCFLVWALYRPASRKLFGNVYTQLISHNTNQSKGNRLRCLQLAPGDSISPHIQFRNCFVREL